MDVLELSVKWHVENDDLVLLDVRDRAEREFARLEPSLWIPLPEIFLRLDELAPYREKQIVVYCHIGVRSAYATQILRQFGFLKAENLSGGIDAWSVNVDPEIPRY